MANKNQALNKHFEDTEAVNSGQSEEAVLMSGAILFLFDGQFDSSRQCSLISFHLLWVSIWWRFMVFYPGG